MSDNHISITISMDETAQKRFEAFRVRHRFKDLTEAVCQAALAAVSCEKQDVVFFSFTATKQSL